MQASHGALRAGVAVLAIALSVLATGGVWAYVNPRVVPTPPEFEVPAPAVLKAELAMLSYRIAAWDCNIARITIERDVMGLPECATLPDTTQEPKQVSGAHARCGTPAALSAAHGRPGEALLRVAEKHGHEGVVSKRRDAPYRSGVCRGWRKVKTTAWREANRERWRLFETPGR